MITGPLLIRTTEPGRPAVECVCISSIVDADGTRVETMVELLRLAPDDAGDLVGKPLVSVEINSRRVTLTNIVVTTWRVTAVGFIEHEADEAQQAAIEELVSACP